MEKGGGRNASSVRVPLLSMVESLKELNQICQKPDYKTKGNWMVRHILRDAALPATWLLLHTPVTANQVTTVSLVIGVAGILLFGHESRSLFLLGALLLQTWYFLDHVDGQIARYRKTASLTGRFFDFITHHIIHGAIFFALSYYCYQHTSHTGFLILGFISSFSMILFNLISDTKYKTFLEYLLQRREFRFKEIRGETTVTENPRKLNFWAFVFSFLHKASEVHVVMNLLTFLAVIQLWTGEGIDARFFLFLFYAVTLPVLAGGKMTFLIWSKKIDSEFRSVFEE